MPEAPTDLSQWILWPDQIGLADVATVGSKAASLAHVRRELGRSREGSGHAGSVDRSDPVATPDGFVIGVAVGEAILAHGPVADALVALRAARRGNPSDVGAGATLATCAAAVRRAILAAPIPLPVQRAIRAAVDELTGEHGGPPMLAVRSSAPAEDLAGASFAGQYDSLLGVRGADQVLDAYLHVLASLFGDRALAYRGTMHAGRSDPAMSPGGDQTRSFAMAVLVQRQVAAETGAAGVMFTGQRDPEGVDLGPVTVIEAVRGLGDALVDGRADPDRFAYTGAGQVVTNLARHSDGVAALTPDDVVRLAGWGERIGLLFGHAVDVEWALDGTTRALVVVQVRPLADPAVRNTMETRHDLAHDLANGRGGRGGNLGKRPDGGAVTGGNVLVTGLAVGTGTTAGTARIVSDPLVDHDFDDGDVLVAETTDPGWLPLMQRAAAIVTDHGGRTSHAAIVCRELGLLAVVGCGDATARLRHDSRVQITCESNGVGVVYGD